VFSAGSVLATTFRIWLRNLPRFVLIAAIFYVPVFGFYFSRHIPAVDDYLQVHYYQPIWKTHPALLTITGADWIAQVLINGAIACCVVAQIRDQRIGMFRALGRTLRRSLSLFCAGLVQHLVAIGATTVVMMCIWSKEEWVWHGTGTYGWVLWSAMWLVVSSFLYQTAPIAVIERRSWTVGRDLALARDNRFKVLAIILVLWVLVVVVDYAMVQLMLGDMEAYSRNFEIYGYVRMLLGLIFSTLSATAMAVTYEQLREAKEGPTPEALDRVFG
jgi:hypothetical protein